MLEAVCSLWHHRSLWFPLRSLRASLRGCSDRLTPRSPWRTMIIPVMCCGWPSWCWKWCWFTILTLMTVWQGATRYHDITFGDKLSSSPFCNRQSTFSVRSPWTHNINIFYCNSYVYILVLPNSQYRFQQLAIKKHSQQFQSWDNAWDKSWFPISAS